jgi:hypothetical protein
LKPILIEYNLALYRPTQVNFDGRIAQDQKVTAFGFACRIHFSDVALSNGSWALLSVAFAWSCCTVLYPGLPNAAYRPF